MKVKKENQGLQRKSARLFLSVISTVAEKNATALCRGLMYEPEVPKKLRK